MDDMDGIINKINEIKNNLDNLENNLKEIKLFAEDKDSIVKITLNGKGKILNYEFSQSSINDKVKEALISATNIGLEKAKKLESEKKKNSIGNIELPDIPGLF